MAEDLKKMYRTVMDDHFPSQVTISFGDQTLVYRKRSWKIPDEKTGDVIEKGLRYGENPGQEAALYELVNGNLVLGDAAYIEPGKGLVSALDESMMLQFGKHPGKDDGGAKQHDVQAVMVRAGHSPGEVYQVADVCLHHDEECQGSVPAEVGKTDGQQDHARDAPHEDVFATHERHGALLNLFADLGDLPLSGRVGDNNAVDHECRYQPCNAHSERQVVHIHDSSLDFWWPDREGRTDDKVGPGRRPLKDIQMPAPI